MRITGSARPGALPRKTPAPVNFLPSGRMAPGTAGSAPLPIHSPAGGFAMSDPFETRSPTLDRRPETRYTREGTGARAPHDGGGRRRRGLLLPLLLGLFALGIGAAILLSLLGDDDDGSAR